MPRGDKSKYTDKQKRQAQHIEESYEERGEKPGGSGHGEPENHEPIRRGGREGGAR
jgi:hypothetical protein